MAHLDNATFERTVTTVRCKALSHLPMVTRASKDRDYSSVGDILFALRCALPDISDPDTMKRVLKRVLDNCHPPMCAWMVAVVYGEVVILFRLAYTVAIKTTNVGFLKGAVEYLYHCSEWSVVSFIFDHYPHIVFYCEVLRSNLKRHSLENDLSFEDFFLKIVRHADVWDPDFLIDLVHDVMTKGLVGQFGVLIDSPRYFVRKLVWRNTKSLMTAVCTERIKYGAGSERSARLDACFMAAAQAGLFAAADPTTGRECMVKAAVANQPDLVLCLHLCGTLGSSDFSAMLERDDVKAIGSKDPARVWGLPSRDISVPFDDEAKKTALEIKSFLAKQASNPLSPEKIRLQYQLKKADWGHGREERIREIDIYDSLRFKGLEKILRKKTQT